MGNNRRSRAERLLIKRSNSFDFQRRKGQLAKVPNDNVGTNTQTGIDRQQRCEFYIKGNGYLRRDLGNANSKVIVKKIVNNAMNKPKFAFLCY